MWNDRVFSRIARQHGALSRQQALVDGLTKAQIETELRSGRWRRRASGVYVVATSPDTWHRRMMVATLVTRGVASHRSALRLHGLTELTQAIDVTVLHGRWKTPRGFHLHLTTQPWGRDLCSQAEIPTTGLSRTLVDVGLLITSEQLDEMVDAALRSGRVRLKDLVGAYRRASRHGRNGCGPMRRLLEERIEADPVPLSAWSRDVVRLLTARGLAPPTMEYRILDESGELLAQVDLAYPASRVAIELDSVRWHLDRKAFHTDRRRDNELALHGWRVLRFTWEDFVESPDRLVATVRDVLASAEKSR